MHYLVINYCNLNTFPWKMDECRKKWRDLHDVYVRERREEKKKWSSCHPEMPLAERGEGRSNEEDSAEVITEERHVQEMQVGKDMIEIRNSVEISAEESRMDCVVEDMTGEEESRKRPSAKYFAQSQQHRRRIEAAPVSSFEQKIIYIYIYSFGRRFYPKRLTSEEYNKRVAMTRQIDKKCS
ncbi:hypothetical protein ABG768_018864 [Culter alburnus]|uniref:MADF domain-containing protein n=1 Tax=Culter alburnus TaxID=194366 RepID=A0AAW2AVE1_CULAL